LSPCSPSEGRAGTGPTNFVLQTGLAFATEASRIPQPLELWEPPHVNSSLTDPGVIESYRGPCFSASRERRSCISACA
jgi:hypothetical protein